MNNKTIIIGLILIIIVAGAIYYYTRPEDNGDSTGSIVNETPNNNDSNINSNTTSEDNNTNAQDSNDTEDGYTMAQVAEHDTADDCWMVINGAVYDVTEYISLHPGGNNILAGCGIDATDIFESKPDSNQPHSEEAVEISENYKIGEIN